MSVASMLVSLELPFEAAKFAILALLLVWLVVQGRTRAVLARSGWNYLVWGFACILASSSTDLAEAIFEASGVDLSDMAEELQAVARGVLVIVGLALAAKGLMSFVPTVWKLEGEIAERRRVEASLREAMTEARHAAHYDKLTSLPNRRLYAERLNEAIEHARRNAEHVALVVLDLNKFKMVNDSVGHAGGDALLREVSERLQAHVPLGSTVARLGGDEFAIVLTGLAPAAAHLEIVRKALVGLESPVLIGGVRTNIGFCAGAALWPRDAETAAELLKCADLALYEAKAEVPGTLRDFTPEMGRAFEMRTQMLSEAENALVEERIVPFYQPKVCLRTGRILGFEALLRWRDQSGVIQPPSGIAAAFEDIELAVRLTDRMLDLVLADCLRWKDEGLEFGKMAVNASSADFRRGDLTERILDRLREVGLAPSILEIEVTETVLIGQSSDRVRTVLEALSGGGLTIALDDFGTGYASLTHLQQFPVDVLKIDRSFVSGIGDQSNSGNAVVDAVLQMARSLNIETVAEGIETRVQAEYLRARGCDVGQGFLFGRPLPEADAARLCRSRRDSLLAWYAATLETRVG